VISQCLRRTIRLHSLCGTCVGQSGDLTLPDIASGSRATPPEAITAFGGTGVGRWVVQVVQRCCGVY
jgi:hypothetical protein